jgi:hypothetical protein
VNSATPYNAPSFPVDSDVEDFARFPDIVKVGTHAPETTLTDLETGNPVNLRDITRQGVTILEFGSLT